MQTARHSSGRPTTTQPPAPRVYSFTCSCCGVTENSRTADAPAGWEINYIDDDGALVFCPSDALNRPLGEFQ